MNLTRFNSLLHARGKLLNTSDLNIVLLMKIKGQ